MGLKYPLFTLLGIFLLICGCLQPYYSPSTPSGTPSENQTDSMNLTSNPPMDPIPNPPSNLSPTNTSPTNSTNVPENQTTLDWRTRARQLDIPDYRKEIGSDGKLILHSGTIQVILPDDSPSAEEFGRIHLYGLRRAYTNTENLFGRPPFAGSDVIKEEFVLNFRNAGECCGLSEDGFPLYWNAGTREEYLQMINLDSPNTIYLQTANWSQIFNGNHELSHRFLWTLSFYSFLDEGLAMYVQDYGDRQPMSCGQGGYEQSGNFTSYTYLCFNDMNRLYNSGDCFWQRIEEKYGQAMVKRIVARMYNKEERDSMRIYFDQSTGSPTARWRSFSGQLLIDLQQAFVPEIGDRFWADFSDFGFSPDMAEGMNYDSELVRAHCQ